ncbi:MAG: hypothetical protein ACRBCS_13865 [Cellvibrionaceae bacterium]
MKKNIHNNNLTRAAQYFLFACLCFLITESLFAESLSETNQGDIQRFIACPVYRDTDAGPKSGCWLATDPSTGQVFDITGGLTKPFDNRAVLVEGQIGNEDRNMCGATVLRPIRTSVLLEEYCTPHVIPAENLSGRRFVLPKTRMSPTNVPRTLPVAPFDKTAFHILFHYNSDFLNYQYSEVMLEKIALTIKAAKPKLVKITGFAATKPYMVSERRLRESSSLALQRAKKVKLALTRLGVNENLIELSMSDTPESIILDASDLIENAVSEETKRRVDIDLVDISVVQQ